MWGENETIKQAFLDKLKGTAFLVKDDTGRDQTSDGHAIYTHMDYNYI